MCNMCGIVSALKPESSYWRKMCEYITDTQVKAFQQNGCTACSRGDIYIKEVVGQKCFAIIDGEIKNYARIRQSLELRGVVFEGESLSELVLLSYFAYGKNSFKLFHGEFAIVIWDGYDKEMVLVRDRLGFKKLFYYYDFQKMVFASEVKSILKFPFVKKDFCDDIYCKLFTLSGSRLNTDTLFDKIYEVPPSSFVVFKDNKLIVESYFSFNIEQSGDSLRQTQSGFNFLLKKGDYCNTATESVMCETEIIDKLEAFVTEFDLPTPYIDLRDLSNFGSREKLADYTSIFSIPRRFKLPVKSCESGDKEFICDFLSTLPPFSYKDEKDISVKEEMYINLLIVLPQVISAKRAVCENIVFPFLEDGVVDYSLKSMQYGEKLLKTCLKKPRIKPRRDNIKALKSLFYKKVTEADFMLGFIEKEELLKFTRLFPRPETMLYLLQVDIWLNKFL